MAKNINTTEKPAEKTIGNLDHKTDKRYLSFVGKVLRIEGGLSFNKHDKGGTTKFGVSLRFLFNNGIDVNKDGVVNEQDVIVLTKEEATELFYDYFYKAAKCDLIENDKIAINVFDMAVNAGVPKAIYLLQHVLNGHGSTLKVDGIIGAKTLAAVNEAEAEVLNPDYCSERVNFYEGICINDPSQKIFLNGWKNRVQQFV